MSEEPGAEGRAPARSPAETVLLAERAAVLILLAVLLYAVVRVLEPFGLAIAFGGFIAIGTWPARKALQDLSPTPPPWLTSLPLVGEQAGAFWGRLRAMQGNISALIAPYGGQIARRLVDVGQAAAGSVVQVLLALVVAAMFWTGGGTGWLPGCATLPAGSAGRSGSRRWMPRGGARCAACPGGWWAPAFCRRC